MQLGDELIARAESTAQGWSWTLPGPRWMHNLCGYAHGAAGIGHAFAELFGATGDSRFKNAAMRAFDYERSWLDPEAKTGLTSAPSRAGRAATPRSRRPTPGAMARPASRCRVCAHRSCLRRPASAAEPRCARGLPTGGPRSSSPARRRTTRCATGPPARQTCCSTPETASRPRHPSSAGRDRAVFQRRETRFPCGTPIGQTPGLMLGFSGIGMLYLRLHDRQVESPLLIGLTASALAA